MVEKFKDELFENMAKMGVGEVINYQATVKGKLNIFPFDLDATDSCLFKIERIQ